MTTVRAASEKPERVMMTRYVPERTRPAKSGRHAGLDRRFLAAREAKNDNGNSGTEAPVESETTPLTVAAAACDAAIQSAKKRTPARPNIAAL